MTNAQPPPLWFRALDRLPRGKYHVFQWLRNTGLLDHSVTIPFNRGQVIVPLLDCIDGFHRSADHYQIKRISRFAELCNSFLGDFDFIDCGAHIGLFSTQFLAHTNHVQTLTAIEPNSHTFPLVEWNLRGTYPKRIECINAAISDFSGRGHLVRPEYGAGSDSWYLVKDEAGEIEVITLASVLRRRISPRIAIKLDVEGQEVAVLSSAAADLRSLERVNLFVEFHQKVLDRIGMSDLQMINSLDSIRPFSWINSADGTPIDSSQAIFAQVGDDQCDLIAVSQ